MGNKRSELEKYLPNDFIIGGFDEHISKIIDSYKKLYDDTPKSDFGSKLHLNYCVFEVSRKFEKIMSLEKSMSKLPSRKRIHWDMRREFIAYAENKICRLYSEKGRGSEILFLKTLIKPE